MLLVSRLLNLASPTKQLVGLKVQHQVLTTIVISIYQVSHCSCFVLCKILHLANISISASISIYLSVAVRIKYFTEIYYCMVFNVQFEYSVTENSPSSCLCINW